MPDHSEIDASLGIYNPASLPPDVLLDEFIARRSLLERALGIVRDNHRGQPQQHLLLLGPRGMGKTTFLLALAYSIQRDAKLAREWLPVIFPEETYGIGDLADFWLQATEQLLHAAGNEGARTEVETLREANPDDIEERAKDLFLRHGAATGKRILLGVENLNDFFDAVSDEAQQHRLRAFLMEDDRVMLAASSTSYFDATGSIDLPFYDFFRTIRLERLTVEESVEVLTRLAELRGDSEVLTVVRKQPERIHSLHVLTGGNPRLIKMIYRLLKEGIDGDARRDLNRLLEDCTPYFKSRIEEISTEERRVFDHVARHWDPIAVGDIQAALRRPSNKISTYLRRLVEGGFLEEAPGSTQKRKVYQVAERFYNIYYLMRFTRSSRRRLEWLVQAMRVIYSPDDFKSWTEKTLAAWKKDGGKSATGEREAFLHALTVASDTPELRKELIGKTLEAAWSHDQLECLDRLLDRELAKQTLGEDFDLIDLFANLPAKEKNRLGYDPRNNAWWYNLTDSLEESGRYIEAEQAYRKAIEIAPDYAPPWNGLGILLASKLRRNDEAEAAFREAIKIDPAYAPPWHGLGNILHDLGCSKEAEQAFRRAIEISPNSAQPWSGLGRVLRNIGRLGEAEQAYRKSIEADPNYAYPWNGLGNLFLNLLNFKEAEQAYRKASEIDPNFANAWNGLGNTLADLGRFDEAEQAYLKAIEIDPKHAYSHAGLSDLLDRLSQVERSRQHAFQAGLLNPLVPWARSQFLKICGKDRDSWLQVLPKLLDVLNSPPIDPEVTEMTLRGLQFVLSNQALSPRDAIAMIEAAGNPEPLADIVLALRSIEEPGLLDKVSPEVRTVAKDFIKRIQAAP
ncbi:tetratricopeptide repeat protein [Luteolibacter arcticus]|uniref:Tetratricopeptide repeat protein n=1 Tax=Luteolibacter arcticus TaxID=1581411 RepID=A0ABT3GLU8_9BACT|nr:tetratricopeptide repeat protein [Luteolibacter arcticus]MCW1924495.1 tetratricopeptide repeat protein [Luteolibacter arcticus]